MLSRKLKVNQRLELCPKIGVAAIKLPHRLQRLQDMLLFSFAREERFLILLIECAVLLRTSRRAKV